MLWGERKLPFISRTRCTNATLGNELITTTSLLFPRQLVGQVLRGIEWHYGRQLVGSHDDMTSIEELRGEVNGRSQDEI